MKTFKALDEASRGCLELAAEILCKTPEHREMLQEVYNLGLKDGEIMALKRQLEVALEKGFPNATA